MANYCEEKALVLYVQQNSSRFMGVDWLKVKFASEFDLQDYTANFKIGNALRQWENLSEDYIINLTDEEIKSLALGMNYGVLVVTDNEGNKKPFTTAVPVILKNWIEGEYQKIDTFHLSVNAKFEGETVMTITIETAQVSEQMVDNKIAEHNESNISHQDIREDIGTKQPKLTSENAGTDISITEVGGIIKINSTAEGVTVHNQLTGRDAENTHPMSSITGLNTALSGKQPTISDLDTIRAGADLGGTSLQPEDIQYISNEEIDEMFE
ncbi:MAG: hypothetical protein KBT03_09565 [Bacteroidales bacterium]|nr:hypothetical protein [Candidatus Scybalousia scybalohippi]